MSAESKLTRFTAEQLERMAHTPSNSTDVYQALLQAAQTERALVDLRALIDADATSSASADLWDQGRKSYAADTLQFMDKLLTQESRALEALAPTDRTEPTHE